MQSIYYQSYDTLIFFISRGKKLFNLLYAYIFCSFLLFLPIVLQSNLQPNYAYRQYAYKKNMSV